MQQMHATVRRSIEITGLLVLSIVIIQAQIIIMPLVLAFFIAIVLLPVHRFLRKNHIPEITSIILSLVLVTLVIGTVTWFLWIQVQGLINDFDEIKKNLSQHINTISLWLDKKAGVSVEEQSAFLQEQKKNISGFINTAFKAAGSFGTFLIYAGLLPVYTFLILYYREVLIRFVFKWFPEKNTAEIHEAINESEIIIKSYLTGLLIQITYMTILLGGILWLFNIKFAFLIGIIFAILNLIPYIGALIGNIIGILLTVTSSNELWHVVTVLLVIAVVQFLDNNILMPSIVGSKVKINPLAALVAVFTGGLLGGITGMFLSIPVTAVLKIIFDRTEQFKQWAILFGDERKEHVNVYHKIIRGQKLKKT